MSSSRSLALETWRAQRAHEFAARFPASAKRCGTLRPLDDGGEPAEYVQQPLQTLSELTRFFQTDPRFKLSRARAREAAIFHLKARGVEPDALDDDEAHAAMASLTNFLNSIGDKL